MEYMRKISSLQTWEDLERELLKDPKLREELKKHETEFQIARSLIGTRLKRKLSQKQLAEKIGTKQPVISRIESMVAHPTISLLQRISLALNSDLHICFKMK